MINLILTMVGYPLAIGVGWLALRFNSQIYVEQRKEYKTDWSIQTMAIIVWAAVVALVGFTTFAYITVANDIYSQYGPELATVVVAALSIPTIVAVWAVSDHVLRTRFP